MLPSDIWQTIGSPQLAELTALVSLTLPFLLKLKKQTSSQKTHILKKMMDSEKKVIFIEYRLMTLS